MSFVIIRCYYFLTLHFPLCTPFYIFFSFLSFALLVLSRYLVLSPENNGYKITSNNFLCV